MRLAGARRLSVGWTTGLGDITLRLTLMSVVFTVAFIIVGLISALYGGQPVLMDWSFVILGFLPYLTVGGWLVALFAIGSIFVEYRGLQIKNASMRQRRHFLGFIAVAIAIVLPTALEFAIKYLGAPKFFGILNFMYLDDFRNYLSFPMWLPLFLTLCALYGFSLLKQSREKRRTESVDGALLKGDAIRVNASSEGGNVNHRTVSRNPSLLWRNIVFRLLLMTALSLVAVFVDASICWFTDDLYDMYFWYVLRSFYFPWLYVYQGLLLYFCVILFAVGSVFVEYRVSRVENLWVWRLGQLIVFVSVLIINVLNAVLTNFGARDIYASWFITGIVCALYGYSLFTQGRDAQRLAALES